MCPPGAVSGRKDGGAACDGLMELKHCGPPLGRRAGVVQESSFDGDKPLPKTPQKILQPVTVVLPGPPTPKGRARVVRRGRVYAPDTTRNSERSIGILALKAMTGQPPSLRGGLSMVANPTPDDAGGHMPCCVHCGKLLAAFGSGVKRFVLQAIKQCGALAKPIVITNHEILPPGKMLTPSGASTSPLASTRASECNTGKLPW